MRARRVLPKQPDLWAVASYWADQADRRKFAPHLDIGEPCCFACGFFHEEWDDPEALASRWNRARLQRAHIVPDALGGSFTERNLVLLCADCHRDSPDFSEPEMMAHWMTSRPTRGNYLVELSRKMADAAGLLDPVPTEAEIRVAVPISRLKLLQSGGMHWGSGVVTSTIIASFVWVLQQIRAKDVAPLLELLDQEQGRIEGPWLRGETSVKIHENAEWRAWSAVGNDLYRLVGLSE